MLPVTALSELDAIKALPGTLKAAMRTLERVWLAGIDPPARVAVHPRLAALAVLEAAALVQLPQKMARPGAIAAAAMARLAHAPTVLGSIDVDGVDDVAPCWRALLMALTAQVPVRWLDGTRPVPAWLDGSAIEVARTAPARFDLAVFSAATPAHEVLEAVRWMRHLLATGQARADDIAITASDPAPFDAYMLALGEQAGIDLHFVHGVPVVVTRDGQAASALGDLLVRGCPMHACAGSCIYATGTRHCCARARQLVAGVAGGCRADVALIMGLPPGVHDCDRLAQCDRPHPRTGHPGETATAAPARGAGSRRSAAGDARVGNLAPRAGNRSRRLADGHAREHEAERWYRSVRRGGLDAGGGAGGLAPALRAPARPKCRAVALNAGRERAAARSCRSRRRTQSPAANAAGCRRF